MDLNDELEKKINKREMEPTLRGGGGRTARGEIDFALPPSSAGPPVCCVCVYSLNQPYYNRVHSYSSRSINLSDTTRALTDAIGVPRYVFLAQVELEDMMGEQTMNRSIVRKYEKGKIRVGSSAQ